MVVPCYVAPYEVGMGVLITCAGIPVYYAGVVWKDKPKWVQNTIGKIYDAHKFRTLNVCCTKLNQTILICILLCFYSAVTVTEVCQKFLVSAKEECDWVVFKMQRNIFRHAASSVGLAFQQEYSKWILLVLFEIKMEKFQTESV